uniref:Uncharacterized protein n=1 Tax=Anguilla anguilla TaxID=7936 RepID=A0A0E9TD36_ANGAN
MESVTSAVFFKVEPFLFTTGALARM